MGFYGYGVLRLWGFTVMGVYGCGGLRLWGFTVVGGYGCGGYGCGGYGCGRAGTYKANRQYGLMDKGIIHYSLFIIHYSLFIIHFSLFIFHYSLFIFLFSLAEGQAQADVQVEIERFVFIYGLYIATVVEIIAYAWLKVYAERWNEVVLHTCRGVD